MKHSRGRYTEAQADRAGRIVGPLGRDIDEIFVSKIGESMQHHGKDDPKYNTQVLEFVEDYHTKQLFDFIPGRQHPSFPQYQYKTTIKNPEKLKFRLEAYSKRLDQERMVQKLVEIKYRSMQDKQT